jgi:hypothetical protein
VLRQHANYRLCTYAKEGKVVLRKHANCRLCTYAKEGKVVLRQHANCGLCTYASEVVLKQHARLLRLEKPDNGKRTSEACKKTGQRRWKENGCYQKRTKELE